MVGIFLFYRSIAGADNFLGQKTGENNITVKLDGKTLKLTVEYYSLNSDKKSYLVSKSFFKNKLIELNGFESQVQSCTPQVVKINGKDAICLEGDVGAHSKNLQIITADFKPVIFYDDEGNAQNFLITDVPDYQFRDYNIDGQTDLIIDLRNYDSNPLVNEIRNYYKGENDKFLFDKKEEVTLQ